MNRIKTGIKLQVTSEESRQVQEICFANDIVWKSGSEQVWLEYKPYLFISNQYITCCDTAEFYNSKMNKEVDAKFFIRTKGKEFIQYLETQPKEVLEQTSEQPTEAKPKQYLVFVPTKGKPKHIHQSLESAQEEAKRLCKSGLCEVMVLEVVSKYQAKVIVEEI